MANKYNARKILADGMTFDSKKEYKRYKELAELENEGQIAELQRQVKFVLIPSQKGADGKTIERECSYIADFAYKDSEGKLQVEDVKGYKYSNAYSYFVIKRKLMLKVHGIRVKEV